MERSHTRATGCLSSEDRRVKDQASFRRERREASGFALDVARQLASFIEATPIERTKHEGNREVAEIVKVVFER